MNSNEIKGFLEGFYSGKNNKKEIELNFNYEIAKAFEEASKHFKKKFSSIAKVSLKNREFFVSDPYLNPDLSLKTLPLIIFNAIFVAKSMGVEKPLVAVLSAVELVNLRMESSVFGAVAEAMGKRKQFGEGVFVEGPLSMDVALSEKAAKEKKVLTEVSGKANVLICHRTSIAKGIVEALQFTENAKIEVFLTEGENILKVC